MGLASVYWIFDKTDADDFGVAIHGLNKYKDDDDFGVDVNAFAKNDVGFGVDINGSSKKRLMLMNVGSKGMDSQEKRKREC